MKIAFVVSFFDLRNDVRKVIEIISLNHKVVVFYKPADEEKILSHKIDNVEYRPILDRNRTLPNMIREQLFLYFKILPQSRNNYFLMELFKISNLKNNKAIRRGKFVLYMQRVLPRLMSYDQLLRILKPAARTEISDIRQFILFSEMVDDYFMSRLIKEKKKIKIYVYSWDHPFKHTRFPSYPKYLCWSQGMKEDLIKMQGIPTSQITVIGASQFGYVYEFNKKLSEGLVQRTFPFEYVYFGCALGIRELVPSELTIVKQLAEITLKIRPDLKFVVRLYPQLENWMMYDEIRKVHNVVIDDGFRQKDLSIKADHIFEKFEKIHHSIAFLHLGTTMGLEACFFDTPSFIIDFSCRGKELLSMYSFVHQTQNEKYLVNASSTNTLKTIDDFIHFLQNSNDPSYHNLNQMVKKQFHLTSFQEFSTVLIDD
ncbi:MAG TPA: hypothetical protein VMU83_18490 [Hanamia sp.]|nr:hypothetical protein [Hanamia sp.]